MNNSFCVVLLVACIATSCSPVTSRAQDSVVVETVLEGLSNPCGVAVQPETGDVFVADSGAQRVVRIVDGRLVPVIVDFPKDTFGNGPIYDIGPLGLVFIDRDTLVVGGGGNPDGEEKVYVFKVPELDAGPLTADKTEGDPVSLPAEDDIVGEGDFYALAKGKRGIYVTCNGDDLKGWVSLVKHNGGTPIDFQRKIATREATKVNAPVAITMSPEGHVTVGQMGNVNLVGDSLLTFYNEEGKLLDSFKTRLNDVSGLAYGPNHGRLFATDFNWLDPNEGGLYKIIAIKDNYEECNARKITKLQKPTALAFNLEGDLYITLAGNAADGLKKPDGKLVVIKGLDVDPDAIANQ